MVRATADLGPAHPPPFHQPGMLGGQIVLAVHPADRSGGLDQHRGQPFVPVPFTGSSDLSMGWSISVRPSAVGGKHDPDPVVIEIFEAVGQPADLLDGFGAAVGDP
jgi:hypothetical protein